MRPAFLQDQAPQPLAIVIKQGSRPHRACDENRVFRQAVACGRVVLADELMH